MSDATSPYIVAAIGGKVFAAKTSEAELKANEKNLNTLAATKFKSNIYDLALANVKKVDAAKDEQDAIQQARRNGLRPPTSEEIHIKAGAKDRDNKTVRKAFELLAKPFTLKNPGKVTLPSTPGHDVAIGKSPVPNEKKRMEIRAQVSSLTVAFRQGKWGRLLENAGAALGMSSLFRTQAYGTAQSATGQTDTYHYIAVHVTAVPDKKEMEALLRDHGIKSLEAFTAHQHFFREVDGGTCGELLTVIPLPAAEAEHYSRYKTPDPKAGYDYGTGATTIHQIQMMEDGFRDRVKRHYGTALLDALTGRDGALLAIDILCCAEAPTDLSAETREQWSQHLKEKASSEKAKAEAAAPNQTAATAAPSMPGGGR